LSCNVTVAAHAIRQATVLGRFGAPFLARPGSRGRGSIIGSDTRSMLALTLRLGWRLVRGDQCVLDLDLLGGVHG
jgi:hypothetical protein